MSLFQIYSRGSCPPVCSLTSSRLPTLPNKWVMIIINQYLDVSIIPAVHYSGWSVFSAWTSHWISIMGRVQCVRYTSPWGQNFHITNVSHTRPQHFPGHGFGDKYLVPMNRVLVPFWGWAPWPLLANVQCQCSMGGYRSSPLQIVK